MNRSIYIFCSIFIFLSFSLAKNQETSISGTVYRNEEAFPLQGANVTLLNTNGDEYGMSTDENGFFSITDLKPGNYSIKISFIGFEDYTENVNIEFGRLYKIDAILSIEPIQMTKLEIISKVDSSYYKLPGSATILDVETLKLINPIGTQEMLEHIPGINGYADDGIGNSRISIGIRGLNPRRSSRVLILEDGIPIQPALYVYPNMYYNPPAERISRLEIIKGSGSIAYGPQTMGGVVNYFTKRPRNEFGGLLTLTAGENGYNSIFTEIGGWGSGNIKPELQMLYKKGDGFRENNSFEQINGTFKINYIKNSNKNIYLKGNINYENSNATYTGLTEWSFNNNPRFNPKKDDNFKVFRSAIDLINYHRINSRLNKTSKAFISFFDRRWWRENDVFIKAQDIDKENAKPQPYYNTGNLVRTGNGKDNFGILRTFYVVGYEESYELKHSFFGSSSKLNTGWRIYWERFIDDKKTGLSTDAREGIYYTGEIEDPTIVGQSHHYETTAISGHISEYFNLGSFSFRPGLRIEIFEQERINRLAGAIYQDKSQYMLLPGIGFTKKITDMTIFGGIHRGFTPPSSGALKILNFGENIVDSGLDLDSEKSWNKELGLRGDFSIINFELSGFITDIENLVAAGRGTAFKNLGKVSSDGLEMRSLLKFSNILPILPNFDFSYTFLRTEIIDGTIISNVAGSYGSEISINGKKLPYAPTHTFNFGIIIKPFSNFSLRSDIRYVGKVFTDFENIEESDNIGVTGSIPSYRIINLSCNYDFNTNVRFFFSGKNITDEIYIGSRLHSNPGQKNANISSGILPGPRRQLNLGVEYSFN